MAARMKHAALTLALVMGAFAGACGGSAPPPETPAGQAASASEGDGASKGDKAEDAAKKAHEPAKSTPVRATKMADDLEKIGIKLDKIPELEKLPLAQKKKVMPLLQRALGLETCQDCHAEGDFKTETRDMKIAREMWRHFVVPLRSEDGGALFCDSCHGGQEHVLNRSDKKALNEFMENEYQGKIARADKEDMECFTCHGDAMETKIIEKLWNIPK